MAFFLALKFIDNSMEQMFEERKEEKDANNKKEEMTVSGSCARLRTPPPNLATKP